MPEERFTIAGMLRAHAAERPDDVLFVEGSVRRSWAEHQARSARVARALLADGVGLGEHVAVLDRNGIATFDVLFGAALMGGVTVPINWRLAPPEIAAIIDDCRAGVLFVHADYLETMDLMTDGLPTVRRIVVLGAETTDGGPDPSRRVGVEEWLAGHPAEDPGHVGRFEEVSLQLYTSGTTGVAKGVMLSNGNFASALGDATETFDVDEHTVSLVAMPLFHIGGTGWALASMSRGGRLVILRDVDLNELLRLIAAERINTAFLVPAVLMVLLMVPAIAETDLSSLDTIFYGASPIAEDVLVQCLQVFGCDFSQLYGLTETTGAISSLAPIDHDPDGPRRYLLRSAGKPFRAVELKVVDPTTGDEAATGAVGEIWVRSPYNMLGYWENPTTTAATITPDGWLRTGDAGFVDADGYLFLHDRIKDMIVSGGENIYPAEIENVLLAHPDVIDAAVIGVPDERWGETVKAIVVRAPTSSVTAEELIAWCRERLAHYKCPTSVDFVETLPRNPTGKVLKRELREPYWAGQDRRIG